ncbi:nitrogen permease regulator 2-domain-containing protein [Mrakia frigida]|uniref:nitrogen permease regulating protein NPR2 n=1 Tax=Mrakia frigida TaxID=29902 RepID=UPI003FCBF4B3
MMGEGKYARNRFRWNVCWVFDRWKYEGGEFESVVRKVARVLRACEAESGLLSSPESSHKIPQILEQLFEDLNSYAETSIPIDKSNSIEIKIFPLLPNPPKVEDWHVPLPLIDLAKMREPNWDLTMDKVVKYIDGVRHIKKIAECADATSTFTRICIEHLLYYQGAMLLDIFQYANMYTVMPALQYLSEASHVMDECAPYSMRDSRLPYPSWPTLLRLYTHLRPGLTVSEWMRRYDVVSLGIDVRRFVSFGVIKGFLRRVHRWPVWRKLEEWEQQQLDFEEEQLRHGGAGSLKGGDAGESGFSNRSIRTASSTTSFPAYQHVDPHHYTSQSAYSFPSQGSPPIGSLNNPYSTNLNSTTFNDLPTAVHGLGHQQPPSRHNSNQQQPTTVLPLTSTLSQNTNTTSSTKPIGVNLSSRSAGDREKQSSKLPPPPPRYSWGDKEYPPSLTVEMLDGETNSDALCVRFQVGWEGERGLERAMRKFARAKGGVLELVYR